MNTDTASLRPGRNTISFQSQGHRLVADLYLPENFDASRPTPTVLYSGPFNQIKEQTGAVYGDAMSARGYAFLAFDHVGFGESEGAVRNFEQPFVKMEAIRDAISFLRTLPFVDRSRLFGLGVCASGGYMAIVATTDKRLTAIATVSGMMNNTATLAALSREDALAAVTAANEARQAEYENGEVVYVDALGMESVDLSAEPKGSARAEGYDFYMTPRAGAQTYPRYSHRAPANLMEYTPLTNATALAPFLFTPWIGIYGERAMQDTAPLTVAFHDAASEPKALVEVPGASHVSLYDQVDDVGVAVDAMDRFFQQHAG